jgi:hypothetical protein
VVYNNCGRAQLHQRMASMIRTKHSQAPRLGIRTQNMDHMISTVVLIPNSTLSTSTHCCSCMSINVVGAANLMVGGSSPKPIHSLTTTTSQPYPIHTCIVSVCHLCRFNAAVFSRPGHLCCLPSFRLCPLGLLSVAPVRRRSAGCLAPLRLSETQ